MPISIQCDQCHRSYNLDDKFAGKTVKCKNCAALMRVPGGTTELESVPEECLACGNRMPHSARVCTACGFNRQTGQRESTQMETEIADRVQARQKKRRWVREPGSHLLESLDQLIKIIFFLALLAGISLTVMHVFKSPTGFSFPALLPTLFILGVLALVMSPLSTLAVSATLRALKIAPREDTYTRILTCVLLPFSISMMAGWPEMAAQWGWATPVAWLVAIGLLIYFLRGDLIEWGASLGAASIALLLSLIFVNIAGSLLTAATGPLYVDMLPPGPWASLATGHSPENGAKPANTGTIADGTPSFIPMPIPTTQGVTPPPDIITPPAQNVTAPPNPRPNRQPPQPAPTPGTQVAINITPQNPPATVASRPAPPPPVPVIVKSNSFSTIAEFKDFAGIQSVAVATGTAETMLTVASDGTTTDVQRWSITNPDKPEKKERIVGVPYFAQRPPVFCLSPKGDAAVAMVSFPRRQLEITYFDNKIAKKIIPFDGTVPAEAAGSFPGFLDINRFTTRWDYKGSTIVQVISTPTGQEARHFNIDVAVPPSDSVVISPSGRLMAVYGTNQNAAPNLPHNQLILVNLDSGNIQGRINVSDLPVRFLGLAFSPDSAQVALYCAVSDLPTIMTFKVTTGAIISQNLLSQVPLDKNFVAPSHSLLWMPGNQNLLVNGADLVSPITGKKFGSLELSGILDQQIVGTSTLALIVPNPDKSTRLALAKLNDKTISDAAK
ncbi:MAG TPA: hypothetical protein VGN88_01340 [Phycisphaerae bacterium]|jgi:hypothetical protein